MASVTSQGAFKNSQSLSLSHLIIMDTKKATQELQNPQPPSNPVSDRPL